MKKLRRAVKKHTQTALENTGVAVALFFVVMLVAQLYGFEDMPFLIANTLSVDEWIGLVVAASLVIAKLLSLPFLLSMPTSPLMKVVGKILSVFVILFWIMVGVQTMMTSTYDQNIGLLGSKVPLMGGLWLILMMLGFLLAVLWHMCRIPYNSKSS